MIGCTSTLRSQARLRNSFFVHSVPLGQGSQLWPIGVGMLQPVLKAQLCVPKMLSDCLLRIKANVVLLYAS